MCQYAPLARPYTAIRLDVVLRATGLGSDRYPIACRWPPQPLDSAEKCRIVDVDRPAFRCTMIGSSGDHLNDSCGVTLEVAKRNMTAHLHIPSRLASQCTICGTMLSGNMSVFYRILGIGRSTRNPNICTRCSTHVEEGRIVEISVLFADLSSFTELTQDLGAEKTHEVVDAYLRMATEILVKHGAFIDKYVGDAVMALFNIPVRQDDHARRAITAAIEINAMLKELGGRFSLPLHVSTGIATGNARVGRLGSDNAKDYTAIGDVVNLSARLQSKAGAGEILVNDECYRLTREDFPDARMEEAQLKGFRDPIQAYRLQMTGMAPLSDEETGTNANRLISVGAIIFGILGAPCAVLTLIGPMAVAVGATGLFGLAGILTFLDQSVLRIPLLILVTLAAAANLYTVWHARNLRAKAQVPEQLKSMTSLERRRTVFVIAASGITFGLVLFELVAHAILH